MSKLIKSNQCLNLFMRSIMSDCTVLFFDYIIIWIKTVKWSYSELENYWLKFIVYKYSTIEISYLQEYASLNNGITNLSFSSVWIPFIEIFFLRYCS